MSNISQFPNKDAMFVGLSYDEETDTETYLLEQFIAGQRTRIGEYSSMQALVVAMDEAVGIERTVKDIKNGQ